MVLKKTQKKRKTRKKRGAYLSALEDSDDEMNDEEGWGADTEFLVKNDQENINAFFNEIRRRQINGSYVIHSPSDELGLEFLHSMMMESLLAGEYVEGIYGVTYAPNRNEGQYGRFFADHFYDADILTERLQIVSENNRFPNDVTQLQSAVEEQIILPHPGGESPNTIMDVDDLSGGRKRRRKKKTQNKKSRKTGRKKNKRRKTKRKRGGIWLGELCTICQEKMKRTKGAIVQTRCVGDDGINRPHTFHLNCINEWLKRDKITCPICRHIINSDGLTIVYPITCSDKCKQKLGKLREFVKEKIKNIRRQRARQIQVAPGRSPVAAPVNLDVVNREYRPSQFDAARHVNEGWRSGGKRKKRRRKSRKKTRTRKNSTKKTGKRRKN